LKEMYKSSLDNNIDFDILYGDCITNITEYCVNNKVCSLVCD